MSRLRSLTIDHSCEKSVQKQMTTRYDLVLNTRLVNPDWRTRKAVVDYFVSSRKLRCRVSTFVEGCRSKCRIRSSRKQKQIIIHIREISIMSGKQNIDSYWWAIENIDFLGTSYVVITKLSLLVKHGLSLLEKRPVKASTQLFAKVNFT